MATVSPTLLRCTALVAMALALPIHAHAYAYTHAQVPDLARDHADVEAVGELMGDLMFHADLLSRLDAMCAPARKRSSRDWQDVLRTLPPHARTPDLRELSRQLSNDAARSMVEASGGCGTPDYSRAYSDTRRDYESLLAQWARLGAPSAPQ